MSRRRFALEPLSVPEASSSALVDLASQAGFDYVSMFAYSPTPQLQADAAISDPEVRRAMQLRMGETGVGLLNLECFNLTAEEDPCNFGAALECGGALGATQATAIVYENDDRSDALAKYRRLCDMAAEHGIRVNLEFFAMCKAIPDLDTAARLEFCEWLPPEVVIGLEVPQMSQFGRTSPLDRARRMMEGIRTLLS